MNNDNKNVYIFIYYCIVVIIVTKEHNILSVTDVTGTWQAIGELHVLFTYMGTDMFPLSQVKLLQHRLCFLWFNANLGLIIQSLLVVSHLISSQANLSSVGPVPMGPAWILYIILQFRKTTNTQKSVWSNCQSLTGMRCILLIVLQAPEVGHCKNVCISNIHHLVHFY